MNYLHNFRQCRKYRYFPRHLKDFIIKILCLINGFSLMFWMCAIDGITSWKPVAVMIFNVLFLFFVLYANGWVYDTKPYFERLKKEGNNG